MSIFQSKITETFFDKNVKTSAKIGYGLILIILLLALNNITSFTYFRHIEKKIESLQNLENLKIKSTDSLTINFIKKTETDLIQRKNLLDHISEFITNLTPRKSDIFNQKTLKEDKLPKNVFLFHLSAAGLFYFAGIFVIPIFLLLVRDQSIGERISIGTLVTCIALAIGLLFSYLFSLIPRVLNNSWWLNYIINFIGQALIIWILSRIGKKTNANNGYK